MGRVEMMNAAATDITVTVAYSPRAGVVDEVTVRLRGGATVADAVRASGMQQRHPTVDLAQAPLGVWGARRGPDDVLREGDRIELYRPLSVDPKEARRRRERSQRGQQVPGEPVKRAR
jgi:uncharacterized protein